MLWQEALNNDRLRPQAIDILEGVLQTTMHEMGIRHQQTLILKVKKDRAPIIKPARHYAFAATDKTGVRLLTHSVACWPMIDRGELAYLKVFIGDTEDSDALARGASC